METVEAMAAPSHSATDHPALDLYQKRSRLRKSLLLGFGGCIAMGTVAYLTHYYQEQAGVVTTDDAYVDAVLAQVTPQLEGTVSNINVHDTEYVKQGDVLVTLDPEDAELDVASAKAAYKQAYQHVQQNMFSVKAAEANVMAKQSALAQARLKFERRENISESG